MILRAFQSQRDFLQVFGKSVWGFEKWTKINVHFRKPIRLFEKSSKFKYII